MIAVTTIAGIEINAVIAMTAFAIQTALEMSSLERGRRKSISPQYRNAQATKTMTIAPWAANARVIADLIDHP
ncbi:MAG: hypothetical protein DHS20C16_25160 [Phycisphaerae bacterium]|nr:MAG: hypothetical protein DHS20C16_25160 [Phycisphaerae bacterium]